MGRIGQKAWNKGLTKETDKRVAAYASKLEVGRKGLTPWNKGKKLGPQSSSHRAKISASHLGKYTNEESWSWKAYASYGAVHYWLRRNFGKAKQCGNIYCSKKSKTYDWALRNGMAYERNRENFIELCRSCHVLNDRQLAKAVSKIWEK